MTADDEGPPGGGVNGGIAMRYGYELGDDVFCAIGRVTAHWAFLEYQRARTTIALSEVFKGLPVNCVSQNLI